MPCVFKGDKATAMTDSFEKALHEYNKVLQETKATCELSSYLSTQVSAQESPPPEL